MSDLELSCDRICDRIPEIADRLSQRLIAFRRQLHANPELSGKETQTAIAVQSLLQESGLEVTSAGRQGLLAHFAGGRSASLALRTDMDALPIQEGTDLGFKSQNPGIMHACGHDIHTTVGVGTALVLAELAAEMGTDTELQKIRFIFQSAEEIAQGANWMVEDGAMQGIEAILSLHVFPSIPVGQVGIRHGALTAAADDLTIEILGESGHGARPHEAVDAIFVAAQVITALQSAIARTQNALQPIVLTLGQISGGRAPNVIADRVKLSGTVRSFLPDSTLVLGPWIENLVSHTCAAYGATCQITYKSAVPSVQNDRTLTKLLETSVIQQLGAEAVFPIVDPSLGAEDFAVYLRHAPGSMFRLGVGGVNRLNYPLHHPLFDPDERSIRVGVITMATAAVRYFYSAQQSTASIL
jgi:amidohydrolase